MLKRLVVPAALALLVVFALPGLAADQPAKSTSVSAQAPALSAEHTARLAKLQRLAAPDPRLTLAVSALPALKPTTVKKEISCGVWLYPPNPNPAAVSPRLYWVNNTGAPLPAGVHIQWEVDGAPATCCRGVNGPTTQAWPPNPPSIFYFYSGNPILMPPQSWTHACRAWAILP